MGSMIKEGTFWLLLQQIKSNPFISQMEETDA